MDSTEFHRYSMDCIKYSVNIDSVHEQLNYLRDVNDSLELTPSQLDAKIKENNERVAQLAKDIAEKQNVLLKLKADLRSLQFNETRSMCARKVYDDGKWPMPTMLRLNFTMFSFTAIQSTHDQPILNSANEIAALNSFLETRLGIKLKLIEDSNQKIWRAEFVFDPNAEESNKYVVFRVDVTASSFSRKCQLS